MAFGWDLSYFPTDAEIKTHVVHRPTNKSAALPLSVAATNKWSFSKNWSESEAMSEDTDGFGNRPVHTVFTPLPYKDNAAWVDFATRTAAGVEEELGDTALVEQAALVWVAAADQERTTTKNEVADASPVKGEESSTSGTGTREPCAESLRQLELQHSS